MAVLRWKGDRRYGGVGLCLVAIACAILFGSLGSARAAVVLLVDDDGAQCPSAAYTDINTAIGAANPGDTIVVCPGTYNATTVDKRVTLSGYTKDLSGKLSTCSDRIHFPANQTTKDSIVAGFYVTADFATIKGFTVTEGSFPAQSGINIPWGTDGVWVTRNVLQDNSIGVNLNGTMSRVENNCFRDNNAGGSASGNGIYSDQGLKSAKINFNIFFRNADGASINLLDAAGPGTVDDLKIQNNTSSLDGDLVSLTGVTNSLIKGNTSTGAVGSAIYVEAGMGPSDVLDINGNTLKSGGDEGIYIAPNALTNSTIKSNTTKGNATFGIHVDVNNEDNSITNNDFRNGGSDFDCADDSSGGGTAGTANTWKKDKGTTSNPPGLCKKK